MTTRRRLLLVAGVALWQGLLATVAHAEAVRTAGQLDLQLSVIEEELAELERLQGDPQQLAEYRLKRLLGRTTSRDYQDLKRSIDMLKGKRFRDLENRKQLIEEAKQQLEIYETVLRYQQGRIRLERVRESLLPVIERDARRYIESGGLAAQKASLEQRRSDLLKIKEAAAAGTGQR